MNSISERCLAHTYIWALSRFFFHNMLVRILQMDKKRKEQPLRKKIDELHSFFTTTRYDVSGIIQYITEHHDEIGDDETSIIDVLWSGIESLQGRCTKNYFKEAIKILGIVFSLHRLVFRMAGVMENVMRLVVYVLKIIFHSSDLCAIFDPKCSIGNINHNELSGVAEKLKNINVCIDNIEEKENVNDLDVHWLVSNVDIHVGVEAIGHLKNLITSMSGKEEIDDMKVCLHLLTLFVRITIIRHSLLFRAEVSITANGGKNGSENFLDYIKNERSASEQFLRFFSVPSLQHVGVLAVFDPAENLELVAYLEVMRLPIHNLRNALSDRIFLIQPVMNQSVLLGRPFPSITAARSMKSSTDVDNIRIRFQFIAIEDSFNLFYIQSPDLQECLYMQRKHYCIYNKKFRDRTGAQWRVIQVWENNEGDDEPSHFVFCTKKRPQKFLYMENSFLEYARGLENKHRPGRECLFRVSIWNIPTYPIKISRKRYQ